MNDHDPHLPGPGPACGRERSTVMPPDGMALSDHYCMERAMVEAFSAADYADDHGWDRVIHQIVAHLEDESGGQLDAVRMQHFVVVVVQFTRALLGAFDERTRSSVLAGLGELAVSWECDRIGGWYEEEG